MKQNFLEKYMPNTISELPLNQNFISLIKNFIDINEMNFLLISEHDFFKNIVVNSLLNEMKLPSHEIIFISQIKDQGVSNIRYELKLFCQTPSSVIGRKKLMIIDDIHLFTDNIQKLFINNIDKWKKNIHFVITCDNVYNVDEGIVSRVFPLYIPIIEKDLIHKKILDISSKESIEMDDDSMEFCLSLPENNIQSLYHILQKFWLLDEYLTLEKVHQCSTLIKPEQISKYISLCKSGKIHKGYNLLLEFIENGYSVIDILNELYLFMKTTKTLEEEEKYSCCKFISKYIINFITIHEEELELLLFTSDMCKIF